jgi:glutamate--cysteine ligase catalytic subunit
MGLLTNVINHFDVDFIIPISLSDENMETAHKRDALVNEKFWVRVDGVSQVSTTLQQSDYLKSGKKATEPRYEKLYVHEIFKGKHEIQYEGLFELMDKFIELKMPS